jgi:hypothetical protein
VICQHGRPQGAPCPWCLGVNGGSAAPRPEYTVEPVRVTGDVWPASVTWVSVKTWYPCALGGWTCELACGHVRYGVQCGTAPPAMLPCYACSAPPSLV